MTNSDQLMIRNIVKEEINIAFDAFTNKFGKVVENIYGELVKIEHRLDAIELRLDKVEQRLDKVEQRLDSLEKRMTILEGEVKNLTIEMRALKDEVYSQKASIVELENTVGGYGDMYTLNREKIDELEKRVYKLETKTKPMILRDANNGE